MFVKKARIWLRGFASKFSTDSNAKQLHERNRLRFIFITSSVGGAMLGYGLAQIFQTPKYLPTRSETTNNEEATPAPAQEQQQQVTPSAESNPAPPPNNLLGFTGKWNYNWDGREAQERKKGRRHITLIRHGQYVLAKEHNDRKLTELGRLQAEIVSKRLKELTPKFDKIYVSDVVRARETAEIVKQYFPDATLIEDPLLAEGYPAPVSPGNPEIKINKKWNTENHGIRISKGFEKYIHRSESDEDTNELFVIHGNVIRYFLCRALQFPVEGWLRLSIYNTGISQLTIRPDGSVSVRSVGDVGHLQKDQITYH